MNSVFLPITNRLKQRSSAPMLINMPHRSRTAQTFDVCSLDYDSNVKAKHSHLRRIEFWKISGISIGSHLNASSVFRELG